MEGKAERKRKREREPEGTGKMYVLTYNSYNKTFFPEETVLRTFNNIAAFQHNRMTMGSLEIQTLHCLQLKITVHRKQLAGCTVTGTPLCLTHRAIVFLSNVRVSYRDHAHSKIFFVLTNHFVTQLYFAWWFIDI